MAGLLAEGLQACGDRAHVDGLRRGQRNQLRAAIAAVGLAKATVVVPAIERLREWKPRLEWAGQLPTVTLQEKVSAALERSETPSV